MSSSSSSASSDVNNDIQPIANAESNTRARPSYPCARCNKIFPTPMAMGGHQNAHRRERAVDWPKPIYYSSHGISLFDPSSISQQKVDSIVISAPPVGSMQPLIPIPPVGSMQPLSSYSLLLAQKMRQDFHHLGKITSLPPSALLASPPPPASWGPPQHPQAPWAPPPPPDFLAPTRPPAPLDPPPSPASTMFFGVPDFFGPSVAARIPPGDGVNSAGVKAEEEEEDEDLDLDLKL